MSKKKQLFPPFLGQRRLCAAVLGLFCGTALDGLAAVHAEAKEFNGKQYHVFLETVSWQQAKAKCAAAGGSLAIVPDQATWDFIKTLSARNIWLGASDEGREGVWKWVNGEPMVFSKWFPGMPDNSKGSEHYLVTWQGRWNDAANDLPVSGYICEWSLKPVASAARLPGSRASADSSKTSDVQQFVGKWKVAFPDEPVRNLDISKTGRLSFVDLRFGFMSGQLVPEGDRSAKVALSDQGTLKLSVGADGGISIQRWKIGQWGKKDATPILGAGTKIGVASADRAIVLRPGWDVLPKGGEVTLKDLSMVLEGWGEAKRNPTTEGEIVIYDKVTYLMPYREALAALGLEKGRPSRKKIACPGFPKDALECVSFDGLFEGQFNRIHLVVDAAEQVVSVQLVAEQPRRTGDLRKAGNVTYNFVETRLKALNTLNVRYQTTAFDAVPLSSQIGYRMPKSNPVLLRVDSVVTAKNRGALEYVQWYVPMPLVDLLKYCIQESTVGR